MIRYMNIGAGATIRFAATAVAITITALLSSEARAALVNWNGNSGLNYNVMSNWDGGFFPEDGFNEEAVIGNGDAVFLNANVTEPAGLQVVGVSSFEVRSGGTLNVKHGIGGGVQPPGDIKLGKSAGLIIQSGGTLTALMGMADLSGTTRLVGPTATFTVGELNLAGSHTLIAEITDPLSHSALSTSGSAALAGALVVDLSAVAPSVGDSWTLMDAGSISGSFANVTSPTLPMGQNVMISTSDGGNGQLVHGTVANQLVLAIDAITGTTSIQNLTAGTSEVINGYSITAPSGNLNPIGWASFQDDGQTGWEKANPSDVNLSELNLNGSRNIGTGSISLGAALAPASQFGVRPEVNFEYNLTDVDTRQGAVSITGYTLVLQVDPTSGEAQIVNPSGFDVKLDLYGILSPSGSLNADAWTPLADGDPDWDEANPASSHLVELNLTGSQQLTKMESGSPLTIGAPFTGGTQDLEFVFNVAPDLLPGDFDGDGDVDGNDFLWWQRGETPDSGSVSELADWQDNYGSIGGFNGGTFTGVVQYVSLGDGLATVTQVPEPACWLLVWTGVMGLVPVQRKTGKRKTGK